MIEITDRPQIAVTRIKAIDSIVEGRVKAETRLIKLASWIRMNYGSTMNQALKTVIPIKESVKAKEKKVVKLIVSQEQAKEYLAEFIRKSNHARVRLLQALIEDELIEYSLITGKLNVTAQTIKSLKKWGLLRFKSVNITVILF